LPASEPQRQDVIMSSVAIERRDHVDAWAAAVLVVLCMLWGVQQVAVKVALNGGLPPALQASLRSAGAAVLVMLWMAVRERRAPRRFVLSGGVTGPGVLIAVLFAAEFLALNPGLRLTTASRGVVFLYTAPFFTALGTHLFVPGERMRLRQATGLVIAFSGVAVAFAEGFRGGGGSIAGDLLCLLGGALWGATTATVKAVPALSRLSSSEVALWQLGGSAPILFVAALALGELHNWPQVTPLAWAALFYQTVIVAFLSYLVWFWLILNYPAGRIAGFTFLTPVFGVLAGAVLLGEPASLALGLGVVAIAVGLRMVNTR
jgi:drug/metabolite transporter (DMT)-like permease